MNLQFFMPTRIIMGEDCILKNADALYKLGKKALIVTGSRSAKVNGSFSDIINTLDVNGQEYAVFDKVMANPTIDCVYEGAAFAKKENVDFIIAIGGGSPMDAAKAIALLACQDIPRENLFLGEYEAKVLPMAFIPTTAGTGSEVTQYSILTNDAARTKTTLAAPFLFPDVSFLDSKYMEALSKVTTINTAIDALSHSVESFLSVRANSLTEVLALDSIGIIVKQFENLKNFALTREDRSQLLYASTLGGMVIAHTGTTAVHSMGYSLTYFKDIDHGRANGLLLTEFMKLVEKSRPDKIKTLLDKMCYASLLDLESVIFELLGDTEVLTLEELESYSDIAMKAKNIPNGIVAPTREELLNIYRAVFKV
jgi:alcohol dehydrogenase class IV